MIPPFFFQVVPRFRSHNPIATYTRTATKMPATIAPENRYFFGKECLHEKREHPEDPVEDQHQPRIKNCEGYNPAYYEVIHHATSFQVPRQQFIVQPANVLRRFWHVREPLEATDRLEIL
jgi:hypothetical protein